MAQVSAITRRYEGRRMDWDDDSRRPVAPALVAFAGTDEAREVRFSSSDIGITRTVGPLGWAILVEALNAAQPGVAQLRGDGAGLTDGRLTPVAAAQLDIELGDLDLGCVAWRLHCRLDLTR